MNQPNWTEPQTGARSPRALRRPRNEAMLRSRERHVSSRSNVNRTERAVSALAGGSLLLVAYRRPRLDLGSALAALAGSALLHRGITGRCQLYGALGVSSEHTDRAGYLGPATSRDWGAAPTANEIERSITIGKSADELYRAFRDPETLQRVMGHFARVSAHGETLEWRIDAPLGRSLVWQSRFVEERPSELLRWESLPGAELPNEGSVRFEPAAANWGTVVRLRFRFDPPGGALGKAATKLFGIVPTTITATALRRFKSLVEAGEIPTTGPNPAARASAYHR